MKRRKRAAARANFIGVALTVLTVCALVAIVAASFVLRPPATDPKTLCRVDATPAAHTLILIDTTDKLERRHRRRLEAVAQQEAAKLARYDRLTLMRIDARRPQEPTIAFSKCLPKPPSEANPIFENPRKMRETWDAEFESGLERALRSAGAGRGQRASPILAALRAASADPDFPPDGRKRRLIIVSDFLEHEPGGFSLYAPADYLAWAQANAQGPADLTGVEVRLTPLDRPDHAKLQAAAIANFWTPYFDAAGAESVSIDPTY